MTEIDRIIDRLKNEGEKFQLRLHPPASEEEIEKFEKETQIQLPKDIKEFYTRCNGLEADADWMFRIIPLKDIAGEKVYLPKNRFHIAEYMIYSDCWIVELQSNDNYVIINNNHGIGEEVTLCSSFISFLDRYLDSNGITSQENGMFAQAHK